MAFNLYFAGSPTNKCIEFMIANNMNALRSQLNDRKEIDKYFLTSEFKGKLFIDSGAFSAHTKGKYVDVDDYIRYCNDHADRFDLVAQVDKIPGEFKKPKTSAQLREAPEQSWDNYLYMRSKLKRKDNLLPIFHQGEDFKHLSRLLEWRDEQGNAIEYIGISPANDLPTVKKIPWISQCFWIIKNSSNPNIKTHAFGMTSLEVLEKFPFYSADSTTYLMNGMFGQMYTNEGWVRMTPEMVDEQSERTESMRKLCEEYGCDFETCCSKEVQGSYERILVNLKHLHKWAQNYSYKGDDKFTRPLFFTKYKNK